VASKVGGQTNGIKSGEGGKLTSNWNREKSCSRYVYVPKHCITLCITKMVIFH